ncbi:MAG: hypothetical protein SGPRY_010208, partial [Prymnesium sp.]
KRHIGRGSLQHLLTRGPMEPLAGVHTARVEHREQMKKEQLIAAMTELGVESDEKEVSFASMAITRTVCDVLEVLRTMGI